MSWTNLAYVFLVPSFLLVDTFLYLSTHDTQIDRRLFNDSIVLDKSRLPAGDVG